MLLRRGGLVVFDGKMGVGQSETVWREGRQSTGAMLYK